MFCVTFADSLLDKARGTAPSVVVGLRLVDVAAMFHRRHTAFGGVELLAFVAYCGGHGEAGAFDRLLLHVESVR
jgi:hypothetical protein